MPRWLILLVLGALLGIAGVIYVQERVLGPRLTLTASNELRKSYEDADAERVRLQRDLAAATKQRDAAVADKATAVADLTASKSGVQNLQEDLNTIISSLPPDPRGGTVQIRAGNVALRSGKLAYDLILTRERGGPQVHANLQIAVAGESMSGVPKTVNLTPVAMTVGNQQVARGSLPVPGDFKPLQATIQIVERDSNRALGMRVLLVK